MRIQLTRNPNRSFLSKCNPNIINQPRHVNCDSWQVTVEQKVRCAENDEIGSKVMIKRTAIPRSADSRNSHWLDWKDCARILSTLGNHKTKRWKHFQTRSASFHKNFCDFFWKKRLLSRVIRAVFWSIPSSPSSKDNNVLMAGVLISDLPYLSGISRGKACRQ
jgi:hypothetical protein